MVSPCGWCPQLKHHCMVWFGVYGYAVQPETQPLRAIHKLVWIVSRCHLTPELCLHTCLYTHVCIYSIDFANVLVWANLSGEIIKVLCHPYWSQTFIATYLLVVRLFLGVSSLLRFVVVCLFPSFYWPSWSSCLCRFNCRTSLSVSDATNLSASSPGVPFSLGALCGGLCFRRSCSFRALFSSLVSVFWAFPSSPRSPFTLMHTLSVTLLLLTSLLSALFFQPSLSPTSCRVSFFQPQDVFPHSCFLLSFTDTLKTRFHTWSVWGWMNWSLVSPQPYRFASAQLISRELHLPCFPRKHSTGKEPGPVFTGKLLL